MAKNHTNRGLTLIEILVVVGIVTLILAFGMVIDVNVFKGDTFRVEQSTIVAVLEKARSRAMANMSESKHGVCYDEEKDSYVIFQNICDSEASTSELVPANINIAENSATDFPTVVFNQLSGTTTSENPITIHIEDGIKLADIIINNEGTINW